MIKICRLASIAPLIYRHFNFVSLTDIIQFQKVHMSSQPSSQGSSELRNAQIYANNKNITIFWVLLTTQLLYSFMYGFFINIPASNTQILTEVPFLHTAFMFILIIIGFGLIFGYYTNLCWSGLGFNLLITALSIETYFLINAFWVKTQLYFKQDDFVNQSYSIYLTYSQSLKFSAVLPEALKCALACIIAFSSILGRAGPLQAYCVSVFGTILYQLARQLVLLRTQYEAGGFKIFLFGSFFGLMLSIFMRRGQAPINKNRNHTTNGQSATFAMVGLLIYWVLFPLLAFDSFTGFTEPKLANTTTIIYEPIILNIVLSISSATLSGILISFGGYGFKAVITCSLGGGIIILSSSPFIANPVLAILLGLLAAFFQYIILYIDAKYIKPKYGPIDSFGYVFLLHSVLGQFFATWNLAIIKAYPRNIDFTWPNNQTDVGLYLGNQWIFAAIGIAIGILLGLLFSFCTYHEQIDHFTDLTYWDNEDGIKTVDQASSAVTFNFIEHSNNLKSTNAYL